MLTLKSVGIPQKLESKRNLVWLSEKFHSDCFKYFVDDYSLNIWVHATSLDLLIFLFVP